MNRKSTPACALLLILIILLAASCNKDGQPDSATSEDEVVSPLVHMDNLDQLSVTFNIDSGNVRIVALLSPTCQVCLRGFSGIQKTLAEHESDMLRAYVIWMPVLEADRKTAATDRTASFHDERATYFWDPNRLAGKVWQEILEIDHVARDVYFLYAADAKWSDSPGEPEYVMRQMQGLNDIAFWNTKQFSAFVESELGRADVHLTVEE